MKKLTRNKQGSNKGRITGAVTLLSIASVASGLAGEKVTVENTKKPPNPLIPAAQKKQWKRVKIELTEAQKAQLAKQGVNTDAIEIRTFDITRLSTKMEN